MSMFIRGDKVNMEHDVRLIQWTCAITMTRLLEQVNGPFSKAAQIIYWIEDFHEILNAELKHVHFLLHKRLKSGELAMTPWSLGGLDTAEECHFFSFFFFLQLWQCLIWKRHEEITHDDAWPLTKQTFTHRCSLSPIPHFVLRSFSFLKSSKPCLAAHYGKDLKLSIR